MIKLFELVKKNFKLLVRAKISSLIIFIGPLLLVTLLGLAYSQSTAFSLTATVYSESYTELSESLITKMTNQDFRVLKQESIDSCIGFVKRGESQACVIFPEGMDTEGSSSNEITFYVDYSQINLVWLMLDVMSARVSERSEEISKELTDDILNRMWFIEEKLKSSQAKVESISSRGKGIQNSSSSTRTGLKQLDISVDFSGIDVVGAKNRSDEISGLIDEINTRASNLSTEVFQLLGDIEDSAAYIESNTNDSGIINEADDIDDVTDDVQDIIDNTTLLITDNADDITTKLTTIRTSFDTINTKLTDTQTKISSAKKKRDDMIPSLDKISGDVKGMVAEINSLRTDLDQALQRIAAIKGKSAEGIAAPIKTKIEPITAQKTHFNSLFPSLLVLIIMITGILLSSTLTVVEKKSKAFFRNNFTPTSYFTFNMSTYVTSLMVLVIQLILFVSVSAAFFETEVIASILLIILIILLASTVFICIGMFIGFLFKTDETANLAAITIIAIMLLFSNAVIPLESLPAYLKDLALFNPFVISEIALKQIIIFQLGFSKILSSLGILAGYAVGLFLLLVSLQNALRKLSLMHFSKTHGPVIVKKKKATMKLTPEEHDDINELAVKEENRPKAEKEDIKG